MRSLSVFGERLRAARKRRGLSQLDLAILAGTTPRHVSFIETGRSRPGRQVVLRIAETLNLSLRDRNVLLTTAGLAPAYPERELDDELMEPVRRVILQILAKHEPYPAFCIAPGLRFLYVNRAGERVQPGLTEMAPEAIIDRWCARLPGQSVQQHQASVYQAIGALRSELFYHPHPNLAELLLKAESHAQDAKLAPDSVQLPLCSTMEIGGQTLRTLTTVMQFDKATEVMMSELRLELVFPADQETAAFFEQLAT